MNVYQAIWEADMNGNGIQPIITKEGADLSKGYVIVNPKIRHREQPIFQEVYIPEYKRESYQLVEKLFDNYTLNQTSKEKILRSESKEVEEFLEFVILTPPIIMTKNYIEEQLHKKFSEQEWYTNLYDLWFRPFNFESGKDLSGFEHVFIGEQKGKSLAGHHFWYKYWLEENADLNPLHKNQIELNCSTNIDQVASTPDFISIGFQLKAYDYEKQRYIKLLKKKCAFFVGLSPEGLLALGTVRAMLQEVISEEFSINDSYYKLGLYMSPDGRSIRTLYPIYNSNEAI
jgi:poly(U)-specific endoribonuclease